MKIKLKSLLKEYTSYDFKAKRPDKANKVIAALQYCDIDMSVGDHRKALKHLKTFEGGQMFTHVQYHYVQSESETDVYFIHQSQHWLRDHKVGVTELYVTVQTFEEYKNNRKGKFVGEAAVPTDDLLKGFKRVTVLKRG